MTEALADTGTGQQQFSGQINAARQQTPTQHNLSSPGHQYKTKCIINVLTVLLECFALHTHSSLHDATMTSVAHYAAGSDGCDGQLVFGAQSECKLFSAITIILPRQDLSDPLVEACGARISGNTLYCRHKRNHFFFYRACGYQRIVLGGVGGEGGASAEKLRSYWSPSRGQQCTGCDALRR